MPPNELSHKIEDALTQVRDQSSFVQSLLIDALGWPIDESAAEVNDIAYYWTQAELRASGLEKNVVDGQIWQIQPLSANQPWGVFLLEFKKPDAFVAGRGMVGPLRQVLRGLVPSRRKGPAAKSWNREHLLFFCTYNYELYRVGYFKSPPGKKTAAPLTAFGWGHGIPARTACQFNLPWLAWPDDTAQDAWLEKWISAFDVEKVTKEFYQELSNWYFWALGKVRFPKDAPKDADGQDALSLIRLITRMIFCWFVKEKGLVPAALFDPDEAPALLNDFDPDSSSYYQAILQNLFFATLNQEMDEREFRKDKQHFMTHTLFRYRRLLRDPVEMLRLFAGIPFMNGGLFECLDKQLGTKERPKYLRIDGFSDRDDNKLAVPNELFFGPEQTADLREAYGESKYRAAKVRGLIHTLNRYKFTLTENTPLEQEVALDPELLGKVFENLLAAYNPETGDTARKQTGSFYTPRAIVDYMVDESLVATLKPKLEAAVANAVTVEDRLRHLFTYNDEPHRFATSEVDAVIRAIDHAKILDPACGSGAFPMGILHKLVFALRKLDPRNERWKARQLEKAEEFRDSEVRERVIAEIEEAFNANELDYGRKLYLIENCIYGVDIQPIAVQISKLRCFISLIVDQKRNDTAENLGIRPLPNLETNFVAANSLVPIARPRQKRLRNPRIEAKERELHLVRERHFSARTPTTKAKHRADDARLRAEIAELLEDDGWDHATARQLAAWDPYDQNATASFFDTEWMFGVKVGKLRVPGKGNATLAGRSAFVNQLPGQMELVEAGEIDSGFDVVIGNPPYVRIQTLKQQDPELVEFYKEHYKSAKKGNYDVYVVFVEAGLSFLRRDGELAYILPHKFFNAQYGEPLRTLIANGHLLHHIVHFGDQQVFPGATNYVCLMFLAKGGSETCRFVRADDFPRWVNSQAQSEGRLPASSISAAEWNFVVGPGAALFERLAGPGSGFSRLGDLTDIFVGLQTSADDVFILNFVERTRNGMRLHSKVLDADVEIEAGLLHPIVSGTDVGSYESLPARQFIIFPYEVAEEQAGLIAFARIKDRWPQTAAYLLRNRTRLENRENGKFSDSAWYRFGRNQNLGIQNRAKVCVPRLVDVLHAALDSDGTHFLDNVDVGGVTWRDAHRSRPLHLLIAFLNSAVLRWLFPQVSAPFRGGFRSANRQFISLLPIPEASPQQEAITVRIVNVLLSLYRYFNEYPARKAGRDALMLGYFEQLLNAIVYELYFPDELHRSGLQFSDLIAKEFNSLANFDLGDAPIDDLRRLFENLYNQNHPIRVAADKLQTLDSVRIVEGRI